MGCVEHYALRHGRRQIRKRQRQWRRLLVQSQFQIQCDVFEKLKFLRPIIVELLDDLVTARHQLFNFRLDHIGRLFGEVHLLTRINL